MRLRATVRGVTSRPRLVVFRSLKHISCQVIDDNERKTIASAYDREVDKSLKGIARAAAIGALIAERAIKHGVTIVVFDRRSYQYHGQVKAVAEAARQAGLQF